MIHRIIKIFSFGFAGLFITSCIFKNDLDFPLVLGEINDFSVEGQKSVSIDKKEKKVLINLEETADISKLKINKVELSKGAEFKEAIGEYINLSKSKSVVVKTYQEYVWTISATQHIDRYIKCDNQVKETVFDEGKKSILVYVADFQPLSKIKINNIKLGPVGSEIKDLTLPATLDCTSEKSFTVKYRGKEEIWTLKIEQVKVNTYITSVESNCYSAKINAVFNAGGKPDIEYRKATEKQWTKADKAVISGTKITVNLQNLEINTEYTARVSTNGEISPEFRFVTKVPVQLYNMSFDDWHKLNNKIWYPYLQDADEEHKIWDSANKGIYAFGGCSTSPEEEFVAASGKGKKAARLESKAVFGKFAAGNLYAGKFVKAIFSFSKPGAALDWGVPFNSRPAFLEGSYAYIPTKISHADKQHEKLKGQEDKAHIIVILTDWDTPFRVNTSENKFLDFDKDPHIIGYAKQECENTGKKYTKFSLPITYRSDRTPKWVSIIATSSALGDYFTGGVGSTLYLDEFSFKYK